MNWLRDPLVLFLVLGGVLAWIHAATRTETSTTPAELRIVVTDDDVTWMAVRFQKTWNRPPTRQEVRNLIDQRVRDEMLYREAMALKLDQGDEALRRRLAMKVEYLAKDAAAAEPSEQELQAYLEANAERYGMAPQRRYTQVYVSREKRGEGAEEHARNLLARLRTEPELDPAAVADVFLLEPMQRLEREVDVARQFGDAFAAAVFRLENGGWQGPVASTYGLHLVRIDEAAAGGAPPLAEVRARVRADVLDARQTEMLEAYVERLRQKYSVELRTTLLDEEP